RNNGSLADARTWHYERVRANPYVVFNDYFFVIPSLAGPRAVRIRKFVIHRPDFHVGTDAHPIANADTPSGGDKDTARKIAVAADWPEWSQKIGGRLTLSVLHELHGSSSVNCLRGKAIWIKK